MRLIGTLKNKFHAERFAACMTLKNVTTHLEQEKDGCEIWIKDEDQVATANEEFEAFTNDPDAPRYSKVVEEATAILKKRDVERQAVQKNLVRIQSRWQSPTTAARTPLTIALIVIACIVTFTTSLGDNPQSPVFRALAFASLTDQQAQDITSPKDPRGTDSEIRTSGIRRFELWRTITPIFIHFGLLHLLFNCMWIFYFGRQIEGRSGSLWLAILVVLIAIPSNSLGSLVPLEWQGSEVANIGKFWIMLSGGLSGVVYGLFGYVWMKVLFDPSSNFYLSPFTIGMLMIWFVICLFAGDGLMGQGTRVNNWAHGGGLVVGLAIGYFPKLISDITAKKPAPKK